MKISLNSYLTTRTLRKVPQVVVYFWLIKLLSTAMGESTSDFLVYQINPYLAVGIGCLGLVLALLLQFTVRRYIAWVYWFAIVMVAVFGTMAADVTHVVLEVPYLYSTVFFTILLSLIFIGWYKSEKTLSIHSINTRKREIFYWATVMATFALGTAAGDMTAATLNLGYGTSFWLFALLFILPAIGFFLFNLNSVVAFWFAYVMTRPLGASFADWFGKPYLGGLGLGDFKIASILTLLIIIAVTFLSITKKDVDKSKSNE